MQRGFYTLYILLGILVVGGLIAGGLYLKNSANTLNTKKTELTQQQTLTASSNTDEKFDKQNVIKTVPFTDSKGNNKQFIVFKTAEEGGIAGADAYITDDQLSSSSAVKISPLSDPDSDLGYAATSEGLTVSVSPNSGQKYVLVVIKIADGSKAVIVDENGKVISGKVVENAMELVKNKCQCGFEFDKWVGNDKFYVKISTAAGGTYQILIDATIGKTASDPRKI